MLADYAVIGTGCMLCANFNGALYCATGEFKCLIKRAGRMQIEDTWDCKSKVFEPGNPNNPRWFKEQTGEVE